MKKPTLIEVRKHFKNAKSIRTQYGKIYEASLIVYGHVPNTYMLDCNGATVWTEEKGYAEIIKTLKQL